MAVAASPKPLTLNDAEEKKTSSALVETWNQFRRHRLALLSLIFIIGLVVLALSADFLRSVGFIDDPTFIHTAPRTAAGTTEGRMVWALPMTCSLDPKRQDPQWCFAAGADQLGRDMMSRLIYGARVSLAVGLIGAITSMTIGLLYGIMAGYYGGRIDNLMMRIIDFLLAVPSLALIILLQTAVQSLYDYKDQISPVFRALIDLDRSMGGLFFIFVVIGLLSWIGVARLARGQVLAFKQKEFILAARAMGARDRRIIIAHLLPNILGPLILVGCLSVPGFIGTEAALSYLGIGVKPPTPSWGDMINQGQLAAIGYPHAILLPALMLTTTILAFNYLADGLRDALDPNLRGI